MGKGGGGRRTRADLDKKIAARDKRRAKRQQLLVHLGAADWVVDPRDARIAALEERQNGLLAAIDYLADDVVVIKRMVKRIAEAKRVRKEQYDARV